MKMLPALSWFKRARQEPVSQPWVVAQPSEVFLINVLAAIAVMGICGTLAFKSLKQPASFIEACGVSARKVQRTIQEIDRKTFHLCTLLVPLIQQILLHSGWTNAECVQLCWYITVTGWTADLSRVYGPDFVRRNWPMAHILREKEKSRLTGACFLSLGCTLTLAISPPSIALASILFLVLGDLSAAIVGVAFGREKVSLKLGREGKKSAEGSLAMLGVCFGTGCLVFAQVELREYPVLLGALAATLTELVEPLALNDNLTIPLASSLAMQWGFARIRQCQIAPGHSVALLREIFAHLDLR